MADDAARSRLGRGLASLIGDVGVETHAPSARAASAAVPIEFVARQSAQSAQACSPTPSSTISPLDPRARHHPADRGAQRAAPTMLRDHRRRTALARGAARRPARGAGRRASKRPTAKRSSLRSSRTCSAPISIRSRRRAAIRRSSTSSSYSQDDIAKIVGKSRSHVANTLRLLNSPDSVKAHIRAGKLTAGHARMLVGQPNAEELADEIVNRGLNVRQVEAMARKASRGAGEGREARSARRKDADTLALEKRVSDALGLVVTSITAASGAFCTSTTAIWSSSKKCCGGWRRTADCRNE